MTPAWMDELKELATGAATVVPRETEFGQEWTKERVDYLAACEPARVKALIAVAQAAEAYTSVDVSRTRAALELLLDALSALREHEHG